MNKIKIFKDNTRIAVKLFIVVWVVLLVHVLLKVTFNYWQPYVIPNEQLQFISDYIDKNKILIIILDSLFYIFNGYIMICCGLQRWHLGKKLNVLVLSMLILVYLSVIFIGQSDLVTLFMAIGLPLIINYKKWFWIIVTFALNNLFLILSLWLASFVSTNDMPYIIGTLFTLDYYFMLLLNYFTFNFLRNYKFNFFKQRKENKNGE